MNEVYLTMKWVIELAVVLWWVVVLHQENELSVKLCNSRPHTNVSSQGQKLTFAKKKNSVERHRSQNQIIFWKF